MTQVVTKGELGRPVGRLRDQMEKLQLHSSHRSEGKASMLEQQLTMADQRVRRLDAEKRAAETRAEQAERRVSSRGGNKWVRTERRTLHITERVLTT